MGPKKKKGGKKSATEKKKKDVGETLTFKETFMIYQLEVKQAQMNEVKEDVEDIKFRNNKQKQRNQFLKNEQSRHVKEVIVQARQYEKTACEAKQVPYEDVEKALNEKRKAINVEVEAKQDMQETIKVIDTDIRNLETTLQQLNLFKEHGQFTNDTHIKVLKKEMEEMQSSFSEMSDFFDKSLAAIKATIMKANEENIVEHKKLASERAIHNLDERTEQEFLDNKWLLKEVEIHNRHVANALLEVENYEKINMEVITELFERQLADVNDTRKFYLACKEEDEHDVETYSKPLTDVTQCANIHVLREENGVTDVISSSEIPVTQEKNGFNEDQVDALKWLDNYLPEYDTYSNEDSYKLDPMEIKLLCVIGTKAPLHASSEYACEENKDSFRKFVVEHEEVTRVTDESFCSD